MKHGIGRLLAFAVLGLAQTAAGDQQSGETQRSDPATVEVSAEKKEFLQHMKELEVKLPAELRRKLIVLSMKLATGWCSPYQAREIEEEIEKLPGPARKKFEKEWKLVREHSAWPSRPPEKTAEAGSRRK